MSDNYIDTSPIGFFRFFCAFLIIAMHYGLNTGIFVEDFDNAGYTIMSFFYMVSGFVLYLGYERRGGINLRQYFFKRAMNILPFYYMAFFMFLLILIYLDRFSFWGFLAGLFCVQAWFPEYQFYINPPAWFVSGLLFFYCTFPFIFLWIKKKSPNYKNLMLSSLLLWFFTVFILNTLLRPEFYSGFFKDYITFIECLPLTHFCSFFMGICGAYYIKQRSVENNNNKWLSFSKTTIIIILFFLSLVVHFIFDFRGYFDYYLPYKSNIYSPIVLILIINLSTNRNILTRLFSLKLFVILGAISYPLYILQAPVYHIYIKFISRPFHFSLIEEFISFFLIMIFISSILSILEKKSISRVYGKHLQA